MKEACLAELTKLVNDDFGFLDGDEFDGAKADVFNDLKNMYYEDSKKSNSKDSSQKKGYSKKNHLNKNLSLNIKDTSRLRHIQKIKEKERKKELYLMKKKRHKYDKVCSKFVKKSNNKEDYYIEKKLIIDKKFLKKVANKKTRQYNDIIPCGSFYKKIFHVENKIDKTYKNYNYIYY